VFPADHGGEDLDRLVAVLEHSVRLHSPMTPLTVHREQANTGGDSRGRWLANVAECSRRTRIWREAVDALPDGEVLGLIDADTCVLGDLTEIELRAFDVAYTVRPNWARYPLNGGVVFVRGGERARQFFRDWVELDAELQRGDVPELLDAYGAIDQAALSHLVNFSTQKARVIALPCAVWNCEDSTWAQFSDHTKILHIKGNLRRCCLGHREPGETYERVHAAWAAVERDLSNTLQPA
jgi:hypothetical protein